MSLSTKNLILSRTVCDQVTSLKIFAESVRLTKEYVENMASEKKPGETVSLLGQNHLPNRILPRLYLGMNLQYGTNQSTGYLFAFPDGSWLYHQHDYLRGSNNNLVLFVGSETVWQFFIQPHLQKAKVTQITETI